MDFKRVPSAYRDSFEIREGSMLLGTLHLQTMEPKMAAFGTKRQRGKKLSRYTVLLQRPDASEARRIGEVWQEQIPCHVYNDTGRLITRTRYTTEWRYQFDGGAYHRVSYRSRTLALAELWRDQWPQDGGA
jgi:hypothetical protein